MNEPITFEYDGERVGLIMLPNGNLAYHNYEANEDYTFYQDNHHPEYELYTGSDCLTSQRIITILNNGRVVKRKTMSRWSV